MEIRAVGCWCDVAPVATVRLDLRPHHHSTPITHTKGNTVNVLLYVVTHLYTWTYAYPWHLAEQTWTYHYENLFTHAQWTTMTWREWWYW